MNAGRILILAFALAAPVAACSQPVPPEPPPTAELVPLAGSEWGLAGNPEPERFVQFGMDGRVTGNAGCNRFFGTYVQDGSSLTIGGIGSTRMACPEPAMSAEQAFLGALGSTRQASGSNLALTLKGEDGATLLDLVRRDAD